MSKDPGQEERPAQSVAQLALPGLWPGAGPASFDPFRLIRDTFGRLVADGPPPGIEVSRRMVRTLGSFTPSRNVIRLSSRLLALGTPAEQEHVVLHEVAHAVVHRRAPKASAHGREFRAVCRELGLEPGRFVKIDNEAWRERLRFAVTCPLCGDQLLRRKRAPRARCGCGAAVRPKTWTQVAVTESGVKRL